VRYDDSTNDRFKELAKPGKVGAMPLRALAALLFLGGIVYAMVSGNWGIGAIAFSLGVVILGLDRLRVAQSRPDRAIGWVLMLCGSLTIMFIVFRMVMGIT
jgi:uncharacterized membrane protein